MFCENCGCMSEDWGFEVPFEFGRLAGLRVMGTGEGTVKGITLVPAPTLATSVADGSGESGMPFDSSTRRLFRDCDWSMDVLVAFALADPFCIEAPCRTYGGTW